MFVLGSFYVGIYTYTRPDSLYKWIVVFNVARGASYDTQIVIEAIADDYQHSPLFLLRRETSDYVASAQSQTSVNKKLDVGILQVMMSDVTHTTYADTTGSDMMLYINIKRLIIQGNNFNDENKLSLISDMRQFNICSNNETSEFYLYWKAAIIVIETEIAHGVHKRRHAAGDSDATNRISHSSFISTNYLIKITIQIFEKDGLKQGIEFKFLSKSWVSLHFTSNNGQRRIAQLYTGRFPFVCALPTQDLRNDHPQKHKNAKMK